MYLGFCQRLTRKLTTTGSLSSSLTIYHVEGNYSNNASYAHYGHFQQAYILSSSYNNEHTILPWVEGCLTVWYFCIVWFCQIDVFLCSEIEGASVSMESGKLLHEAEK